MNNSKKNYMINTNFIKRVGKYLYVFSEPLYKDGQHQSIRIDTPPMPFTDMKNYIDKLIQDTRDDNDIEVEIITAEHDTEPCPYCGYRGLDGGISVYDKRDNSLIFTRQLCGRCLLNQYFMIKMTSTSARGE